MPAHSVSASFGAWVRRRRRALDLTQAQLGDLAACTESAIRKIEADERRPSRRIAERMADALLIAPDEREAFIGAARGESRADRLEDGGAIVPVLPGNLPPLAARLIGREPELQQIAARLADPDGRLLTLTGPGGIGKSRLAQAAGAAQQAACPDGVWFVPLASVTTEDVLLSSIAQVLGITFGADASPLVQLGAHLRHRKALLILDNFEQLLGAAGAVVALLEATAHVRILVTSRERLGVSAEWLLPLDGLSCDRPDGEIAPAVQLFCERAQRVRVDFPQDHAELAQAAAICRLVGGMPLAVELAAAWVRLLGCDEIHDEIQATLDFLQGTARDTNARHGSLRATFQHSMDRLTPAEREAFAALSLFRAPFDREAAQAVAGAPLTTLASLADKSLVKALGGGRFTVHELLRQFGAEMLAADPAIEGARRLAHAEYFHRFVVRHESVLATAEGVQIARSLLPVFPDARAALPTLLEARRYADALDYGYCVLWVYESVGFYGEAVEHYRELLRCAQAALRTEDDPALRALLCHAHIGVAFYLLRWGRTDEAVREYEAAVRWGRTVDDRSGLGVAASGLAMACTMLGDRERAAMALSEFQQVPLADIQRRAGNASYMAATVGHILGLGGPAEALRPFFERVLGSMREGTGHPVLLAQMEICAGDIARRTGRSDAAIDHWHRASAALATVAKRHPGQVTIDWRLGQLLIQASRPEAARHHLANALSLARDCGFDPYIALALTHLGALESLLGNHEAAVGHLREALAVNRERGIVRGYLSSSAKLGAALDRAGHPTEAYAVWREGVVFALDHAAPAPALDMLTRMADLLPVRPALPSADMPGDIGALRAGLEALPVTLPA